MSVKEAILVVDDEIILLLSMRQELKLAFGSRFAFEMATSAQDALAAIERLGGQGTPIVLIISDWLMPGMHGDELLRKVHAEHPSIKLVLLSGHAEDAQMNALAEEVGLYAYLNKPYRRTELIDLVRGAVAADR
jgi:DNA-binding NtrC family response regulator